MKLQVNNVTSQGDEKTFFSLKFKQRNLKSDNIN